MESINNEVVFKFSSDTLLNIIIVILIIILVYFLMKSPCFYNSIFSSFFGGGKHTSSKIINKEEKSISISNSNSNSNSNTDTDDDDDDDSDESHTEYFGATNLAASGGCPAFTGTDTPPLAKGANVADSTYQPIVKDDGSGLLCGNDKTNMVRTVAGDKDNCYVTQDGKKYYKFAKKNIYHTTTGGKNCFQFSDKCKASIIDCKKGEPKDNAEKFTNVNFHNIVQNPDDSEDDDNEKNEELDEDTTSSSEGTYADDNAYQFDGNQITGYNS